MTSNLSKVDLNTLRVFKELFLNPGREQTYRDLCDWAKLNGQSRLENLSKESAKEKDETEAEFNRLCIGPYKLVVIPYENAWRGQGKALNGRIAADVADFYASAGLSSNSSLNEYPDFFGNELEFIYFLEALREEESEKGNFKLVKQIDDLQNAFREEHFDFWYRPFLEKLAAETRLEFWKEVSEVLCRCLQKGKSQKNSGFSSPSSLKED